MTKAAPTRLSLFFFAAAMTMTAPVASATEDNTTAGQAVTALEGTFGVTPGQRRNHVKGTCAVGEFTGVPNAYSNSALFSGKPVPVVARFSLAGGNPKVPDTAKSARGMALEFRMPDGALQHMTMLNTPMFGAAHPQTFLDLIVAMKPNPATGKPDPDKIKAFKDTHPDALAQADFLARNNPPPNYADSAFYGIHTFKFLGKKHKVTLVRWRFIPQGGEKRLSDSELSSMPTNFLEQALIDRVKQQPAKWDMMIAIGQKGDPVDNPTVEWPADRKQVKVGTLTISSAMPQNGAECEKINYDPLVMADGIAPSSDPILNFRSGAYAVSFSKRLSGM